jgi:hypothetical protein
MPQAESTAAILMFLFADVNRDTDKPARSPRKLRRACLSRQPETARKRHLKNSENKHVSSFWQSVTSQLIIAYH